MTGKRYWQLYDASVKALAKKMKISVWKVHELAMLQTNVGNIYDPHLRLGIVWRAWKAEQGFVLTFGGCQAFTVH